MSLTPIFDRNVAELKVHYSLERPGTWFRVGCHTNQDGHQSNASLLIVGAVCLCDGTVDQALVYFGEYVERVKDGEKGHANVEALLYLQKIQGGQAKLSMYSEFQNDKNPVAVIVRV